MFIPWSSTPFFWRWLQEISLFTHATRAALLHVSTYVTYKCVTVNGVCFGPYMDVFPCDVVSDDGLSCTLSGRTVLYITQGSSRTDTLWVPYMYLVVILVAYRIALLLLMIFPPDKVIATVKGIFASETNDVLVKGMASLRRIEGAQQCNRHYSTHPHNQLALSIIAFLTVPYSQCSVFSIFCILNVLYSQHSKIYSQCSVLYSQCSVFSLFITGQLS